MEGGGWAGVEGGREWRVGQCGGWDSAEGGGCDGVEGMVAEQKNGKSLRLDVFTDL